MMANAPSRLVQLPPLVGRSSTTFFLILQVQPTDISVTWKLGLKQHCNDSNMQNITINTVSNRQQEGVP